MPSLGLGLRLRLELKVGPNYMLPRSFFMLPRYKLTSHSQTARVVYLDQGYFFQVKMMPTQQLTCCRRLRVRSAHESASIPLGKSTPDPDRQSHNSFK